MQESNFLILQKLRKILKNKIDRDILDIFIIGSSLKNKISPNDLDIIVLFNEKNLKIVEEHLYEIKESLSFIRQVHVEPLFSENLFNESIFLTILHEGYSIKQGKYIFDLINLKSFIIFSYNLNKLSKIDKVRFSQALYGRNKNGLLNLEQGIHLGQGSIMVPILKEEIFKEFFKKWKINFSRKKAFVNS